MFLPLRYVRFSKPPVVFGTVDTIHGRKSRVPLLLNTAPKLVPKFHVHPDPTPGSYSRFILGTGKTSLITPLQKGSEGYYYAVVETVDATRLHQYYFRWRNSFPNDYTREVYHPNSRMTISPTNNGRVEIMQVSKMFVVEYSQINRFA